MFCNQNLQVKKIILSFSLLNISLSLSLSHVLHVLHSPETKLLLHLIFFHGIKALSS